MCTPTATRTDVRRHADGTETYIEVTKRIDVIEATVRTRVYRGVPDIEITNCFCCSCDDTDMMTVSDPLCRNHGYGFGTRPCEQHHTDGATLEDPVTGEDTGVVPDSVQTKRAADKFRHDEWEAKHRVQ